MTTGSVGQPAPTGDAGNATTQHLIPVKGYRATARSPLKKHEVIEVKKKLEIFEEMKDLEYNIAHPRFELVHEYYKNGYLCCLNEMFDILELGDDVSGIDPEYIFGDKNNEVLQPRE